MTSDIYYEKYILYKQKYTNLKTLLQSGGVFLSVNNKNIGKVLLRQGAKNKKNFAIAIQYNNTLNQERHITLAFINNFPLDPKTGFPVLSLIQPFFDKWYEILNSNFIKSTSYTQYDILRSNNIVPRTTSIYFEPKLGTVIKYTLEDLIQKYLQEIQKIVTGNNKYTTITISPPHSCVHQGKTICAHSNVFGNVQNAMLPTTIDISNINLF